MKYTMLALVLFTAAAHANAEDDATTTCAGAIRTSLGYPDGLKMLWAKSITVAVGTQGKWFVVLPVQGLNRFGSAVQKRYVCKVFGGKVVEMTGQ